MLKHEEPLGMAFSPSIPLACARFQIKYSGFSFCIMTGFQTEFATFKLINN